MSQPVSYPDYQTFAAAAAHVSAGFIATGRPVKGSDLDPGLLELLKIRVSQINSCAFCLALHLARARGLAVAQEKLDLLPTWREAGVFSDRERAALDWAEHLTKMAMGHIPDTAYAAVRQEFSEAEALHLTSAIATINAWNRICGGLRFPVDQIPIG